MTDNPLDYVVSLSNLIKQEESRRKLAADLLLFLSSLIVTAVIITVFGFEVPAIIFYVIGAILFIYLILIARWLSETVTKIFTQSSFYKWNFDKALNDWAFQGILEKDEKERSLIITDSDAGCFIKNKSWANFEMLFQFKVFNEHGFGLIFHAQVPDNYLMFKIQTGQKITPHYRNRDGWQILQQGIGENPIPNIENQWSAGEIKVVGREVFIKIEKQSFHYIIPDNVIINHITNIKNALNNPLVVPMTCSEGSIGFRAHSAEKVMFKNIQISSITKKEFAAKGKIR